VAVVTAWITFHTTRRPEALIGATELRSLEDPGRKLVVMLRGEQQGLFRDVVERGVASGDFRTPHQREATSAIIDMGRSVASWYRVDGDVEPDQLARRYADLALATVRWTGLHSDS